jgi:hypothetical protein
LFGCRLFIEPQELMLSLPPFAPFFYQHNRFSLVIMFGHVGQ